MIELTEKRQYNKKFYYVGAGEFKMRAHIGHIHYKDSNGDFQESAFVPVDKGSYYEMSKHNYHLQVAKDFAAPILMRYENHYEGANHTITYEPFALAWYNSQTDDLQIFRSQQSVQAVYNADKNSFYYTNAFGNGIDFEITIQRSGFKKEVVIPTKPAAFPTPPTAGHKMVALFKYGGTGLKVLKDTGGEWDKVSYLEHDGGFEIEEVLNPVAKSFIRPAYGEDAEGNRIRLKVAWKLRAGNLWQIKEIPLDKMQQASFPVRFDTVTSYYAGAGDGHVINQGSSTWSTVRDAATGSSADYTSASHSEYVGKYSTNLYRIYRPFTPVDTSGLPSGAVISSASLFLYAVSKQNYDNDGNDYLAVVQSSQASPTSLTTADFDAVSFTEGSSQIDITSISTGGYIEFVLNATGLSWIDDTGYTYLAWLEGHDINNDPIVLNNYQYNSLSCSSSEETGTGQDPYLEVTYTTGTYIYPSAQALTFSLPAETVTGQAQVSVNAQSATFSLPTETVTANWTISPDAQVATFSIPSYIVSAGGIVLMPSVQTLTFSLPAEQILAGAVLSPDGQTLTFSVQTASVTADWTVGVDPQVLTVTVPTLEFIGALWARASRNAGDWTRGARNDDY